ncbi:MAG: tungsten formylmethanofuran dehydrogenase [Bacteroidetes bacterium]|nr:tungsten formylmethanofuran dehydrogenase [Bacteroidota bacterium]
MAGTGTVKSNQKSIDKETLLKGYSLMQTAKKMAELYEENKEVTSKYVHATSRGHEAIQVALGLQLLPQDYVAPYYRDDSILLSIGLTPYELMLQLLAKKNDPFSGGRTYYSHPSLRRDDMPKIPHQSSATGMQTIPTTGIAQGIKYLESQNLSDYGDELPPVVVCSLGDGALTEGEISEAFQMAVLHTYPIIYLVQDNEWDISAHSNEVRAMDASGFAKGFKGLEVHSVDGSNFMDSFTTIRKVIDKVRRERRPFLIHAKVPLLGHHTSGVRKEWYRPEEDLKEHESRDPIPIFKDHLLEFGIEEKVLDKIEAEAEKTVQRDYTKAIQEPDPDNLMEHIFVPTPVTEEKGQRKPENGEEVVMVDAALHAIKEIMAKHPESVFYGQDVGGELGGVFREAALLAKKYGDQRVFNTPIQEAYIIGSTVGMSVAGCKPIVEVQFADYIWPGLNQLFTEVSRSCYLSHGKWPIQTLIRIPIGAYGSGGPYHSSSVETVLLNIRGIKVVYPSNAADLKGLMKAAFYDPNPVVMLEHKGLYWSKVPGTKEAKTIEPDEDYIIPLGKGRIALEADPEKTENGESLTIITYGRGVYWAKNAAAKFPGQIEVLDLRTLNPLDEEMIFNSVRKHNKCIVLTEEQLPNSFAESLAGRISKECFESLDGPVSPIGSENAPAIPLNENLEKMMLPSEEKVEALIQELLNY